MGRFGQKGQVATALVVAAIAVGLVMPATAVANDGESMLVGPVSGSGEHKEFPMSVMAIDREQAEKAGNLVVEVDGFEVLVDGETGDEIARVPVGAKVPVAPSEGSLESAEAFDIPPSPEGTVYGDCGNSYIDIWDDPTPNWGQFWTGFQVNGWAYDFAWYQEIYSEDGVESDLWSDTGPMVPDNDWTSGIKGFKTAAPGKLHTGWIYYGVAWLLDGRVCWSGNPVDWNVRIY